MYNHNEFEYIVVFGLKHTNKQKQKKIKNFIYIFLKKNNKPLKTNLS